MTEITLKKLSLAGVMAHLQPCLMVPCLHSACFSCASHRAREEVFILTIILTGFRAN